ncbi:MAG: cob(I)yrinic acid a,c-diamide adenosyltransferase [Chitinophagales bacterium]|nr:cob(I)yrinic acid a,c-diamide adenosyltransferase [Chitinophagales bacterium]
MKIYTKKGDKGKTSLIGGTRVSKGHRRIESYGTVDELNSYLGLIRDSCADEPSRTVIKTIQDRLFNVGASLASDPEKSVMKIPDLKEEDVLLLETEMDRMNEVLPELKNFILPGGHPLVSHCHIARCICRRAERLVVLLATKDFVEPIIVQYLNRLSDYLFVLARYQGSLLGVEEIVWAPRTL